MVNAAGFSAPALARGLRGLDAKSIPVPYFARGHYFTVSGASPFRRLIYPVPGADGLGIHVALDLGGFCTPGRQPLADLVRSDRAVDDLHERRLARPVLAHQGVDRACLDVQVDIVERLHAGERRGYYPGLADGVLSPGFVGVRPKLAPAGAGFVDFVLQGREVHGAAGLLHLYGIDSPGLTSSLALADEVARRLQ